MREKIQNPGGKLSKKTALEKREKITRDMENLMISIIKEEIPKREELNEHHTLQSMDYFMGADICVVSNCKDVKSQDFGWKSYDYLVTAHPYEISWILCEIRDIYQNNDFYDAYIKYPLFGKFTFLYMKHSKKHETFSTAKPNKDRDKLYDWVQWMSRMEFESPWNLEKSILLDVFQDMIYSFNSFLPNEKTEDMISIDKSYMTDKHIGAKS
tara:strand:+ start:28 stop:663 length:636 start_codon:yes stop_codon:yes gene_type:complete